MRTDTITSIIDLQDVLNAEAEYQYQSEDILALERLIGTYETYGAWSSGKPKLSKDCA